MSRLIARPASLRFAGRGFRGVYLFALILTLLSSPSDGSTVHCTSDSVQSCTCDAGKYLPDEPEQSEACSSLRLKCRFAGFGGLDCGAETCSCSNG